jgi:hypothetical protein
MYFLITLINAHMLWAFASPRKVPVPRSWSKARNHELSLLNHVQTAAFFLLIFPSFSISKLLFTKSNLSTSAPRVANQCQTYTPFQKFFPIFSIYQTWLLLLLSNNYPYTEYKISSYSELLSSTCWARAANLEKSTSGRSLQVYKNELNNPNYSRKSSTITDALQVEFWVQCYM